MKLQLKSLNKIILATLTLAGCSHASTKEESPSVNMPVVASYRLQPHQETRLPKSVGSYEATLLAAKIKNQDVVRLARVLSSTPKQPTFVAVELARGIGFAPISWTVALPDGREFNLTGAESATAIERKFEANAANRYRDNLFFQSGVVASLFPMTNRLTGKSTDGQLLSAKVEGQDVVMPVNNTANIPHAIPHHLHGLLFGQLAMAPSSGQMIQVSNQSASATGVFRVGPELWTGMTLVETTNEITPKGYVFRMKVKNVGTVPVPVGAGAHPYFASPDLGRDAIKVRVPARELVVINNLSDVLPTGEIVPLEKADPALDFTREAGTALYDQEIAGNMSGSRLDNLWVDLQKDKQGFAFVEVFYPKSHLKVRMTALTKNVIGVQGYAPKYQDGKTPFIALELVTNLPDPRKELWGSTPTGMQLLKPGETFEYGYKIEVSSLK